jgi:uroporphyrinogen decarboxylase
MWRHFPVDDLYADKLAKKQLEYLDKFDSLVMKVSPNGRYCVVDWGCEIAFDEKRMSGSAHCTKYRINTMDDWSTLEDLDVTQGMFGEQLKALELITKGMKIQTPFVETIFNPLMVAAKLTEKKGLILKSIQENPIAFHEGLKTITKVMIDFAKISIENGAAGIFLATQEATYDLLSENQFKEFGMDYDLQLLNAIKGKADFNMVHIHGDNIMFDYIAKNYPVEALNWHDQLTAPSIAEASKKFDGILMGGIEEKEFLLKASNKELTSRIKEVIDSVNGQRLIIAPGCVIPINIPDEKVDVIVNYLKSH